MQEQRCRLVFKMGWAVSLPLHTVEDNLPIAAKPGAAGGATILQAEQNMRFCLSIASHAAVIDKGHIVHRDDVAGLRANTDIRRRYLAM